MVCWCPAGIVFVGELGGWIANELAARWVRQIRGAKQVPARLENIVVGDDATSNEDKTLDFCQSSVFIFLSSTLNPHALLSV